MKILSYKFFLINFLLAGFAYTVDIDREYELGEETVVPIYYPSISLLGGANLGHSVKGIGHSNYKRQDKSFTYNSGVAIEVGLLKYLNAGFLIESNIISELLKKGKDNYYNMRLSFFAKPFIGINERLAIYSRLSLGFGWMSNQARFNVDPREADRSLYVDNPLAAELNAGATLGVSFFPFTRIGFSLEGGVRAGYIFVNNKASFVNHLVPEGVEVGEVRNEQFLHYEFPIYLSLIAIF